jgi:hypothetical protein
MGFFEDVGEFSFDSRNEMMRWRILIISSENF